MPDLKVDIAGVTLKNPVIAASGTFGFGHEYAEFFDISELGAISVKGLTPKRREGNAPPRIAETPSGILNSVGLQNPGIDAFVTDELPFLRRFDVKIIANVSGNTLEEYTEIVRKASDAGVDLIEVNVSCPNVKAGGLAFGVSAAAVADVTASAKKNSACPVIIKLSPNVTDIAEIARAAEESGADAISLINTVLAMRIDVKTRRPILRQNMGGLSGPAVLPIACRMVWQVKNAVKIPIIGMGGVSSGEDLAELMLAGASAVSIGTASVSDPYAPVRILKEFTGFLKSENIKRARELTGGVLPWQTP